MNAAPVFLALALVFGVAAYRRPSLAVAGLVAVDPFALYRYVGPTTITCFTIEETELRRIDAPNYCIVASRAKR